MCLEITFPKWADALCRLIHQLDDTYYNSNLPEGSEVSFIKYFQSPTKAVWNVTNNAQALLII